MLLNRRMVGFHLLVLVLIPAFIWLGFWQYGRFEARLAYVERVEANMAAPALDVSELSAPGEPVPDPLRWHRVSATGRYDQARELYVRNRSVDSGPGMFVITPLVTADGTAVWVNRGWVANPAVATASPEVPPVPEGEVTVVGRLDRSETEAETGIRDRGGVPEGQVMLIDVPSLAEGLPYPSYGGYVTLIEQTPAETVLEPVPPPSANYGLNIAYAVQWWLFAVIAVVGWVFMVRRELAEHRAAAAAGPPPAARVGTP
ncbi:cytochrome oxidase assembly protein ShyY1 [Allonocardiopsis opalescens]|uniref:SURF1-like protein n=1 Tax=Allonocardiopsis opalescens TaxID=1144618 RepID=A0A2T0Q6J1_9ACTN|nr:cytochrome oxidase assembly protein ShyY1 [Allonocardiopsis opalescens]